MSVYYFTAEWCAGCKAFKPTVQTVSRELGIPVNYVNVDYESELVEKYNVTSVPTLMVVDQGGNVLFRNSGVMPSHQLSEVFSRYK